MKETNDLKVEIVDIRPIGDGNIFDFDGNWIGHFERRVMSLDEIREYYGSNAPIDELRTRKTT